MTEVNGETNVFTKLARKHLLIQDRLISDSAHDPVQQHFIIL